MLSVLAGLLAVAFLALAQRGTPARRRLIAVGVVLVGLAAAAAVAGLIVGSFECWDDCDDRSTRWSDDPDAWQWKVVIVLPALGLGATIAATYAAMHSRFRRAQIAILVAAAFLGTWVPLVQHGGGVAGL